MENDIKKFLESIQELKSQTFKVDKTDNRESFECKKISFKQQKGLISTVTEGTSGVLRFQKLLNDMIVENTGINDWLVVEKIPVLVQMRIESLGKTLKINGKEIDLTTLKLAKTFDVETTKTIENSVNVQLKIPTLLDENKVLNYAVDILKNNKDGDIGKDITNIFTFEIIKYIDSVTFNEQTLKFDALPVKDRVSVVENLPISLNKEIVKFIETLKENEKEQLRVDIDGETLYIDIDVTFFDN
jgi:hypothetical protein